MHIHMKPFRFSFSKNIKPKQGKKCEEQTQKGCRSLILIDECLKHSDYTRVSIAFSCCLGIIYIVLGIISLI